MCFIGRFINKVPAIYELFIAKKQLAHDWYSWAFLFSMVDINTMVGKKYGRLTVLGEEPKKGRKRMILSLCECGNKLVASMVDIRFGNTKSCGCITMERVSNLKRSHSMSNKREYRIFRGIIGRCYNKNTKSYFMYGGAGITVCERWRHSFENFFLDMGERPSPIHSIDRIDNNGSYSAENCKWSTPKEQARNRKSTKWIEHNGQTKSLQEWADLLCINRTNIAKKIKNGFCLSEIINYYKNKKNGTT